MNHRESMEFFMIKEHPSSHQEYLKDMRPGHE